jgi:lauroyl/myristoyl acyltransferase
VALVLPADHFVSDEGRFIDALQEAARTAERGYLVCLGVVATAPATGYGYIRIGAALHPVSIWHDDDTAGGRLVIRWHDEVAVPTTGRTREKVTDMTQRVADEFGAAITAHPEHWHMLQPLWLADLPVSRR